MVKITLRQKTTLTILLVILVLAVAFTASSILFTRNGLLSATRDNLTFSANLMDRLVTTHINLLKSEAANVAKHIVTAESADEIEKALRAEVEKSEYFIAASIINSDGLMVQYGAIAAPKEMISSNYVDLALSGMPVMTTTYIDSVTGRIAMGVCVPLDDQRVLACAIDGMDFSDLLSQYMFWGEGHVYMVDAEGVMIASANAQRVQERYNFIEIAKTDPAYQSMGEFVSRMIRDKEGFGQYTFEGAERYCAFKTAEGSLVNWTVAVIAPWDNSPMEGVQNGVLISGLLFVIVGALFAALTSRSLSKPYYTIREQAAHLKQLSKVAEEASQAKSRFLANTSHEMRTPLNAIIGLSELSLSQDTMSDTLRDNIEKVHAGGMMLLGIVDDILDLSKIEAGRMEFLESWYDTPSPINDVVCTNVVRIGARPITFVLDINADFPSRLYGDELRVKQILNNLLSNAIKYTKEGTVTWRLRWEMQGDTVWFVTDIIDTGIGIKEEDIPRLFGEYNQVDAKTNRGVQGTGLGLSIALQMASLMNGKISVSSVYGEGSTFTLRIPQGTGPAAPIGETLANDLIRSNYSESRREEHSKLNRVPMPYARILVVDDVETNLDVTRGILKPYKMQVDCATSGFEAIKRIEAEEVRYDAIFMDHMMPEMDGVEATARIRALGSDYAKNIPILALTANAIAGNAEIFLNSGFQAFLPKPIDITLMDSALREWVRDKEKEKQWRQDNPEVPPTKPTVSSLHYLDTIHGLVYAPAVLRFDGDETIYFEVLQTYLRTTPDALAKMRETMDTRISDYAVYAHAIKGASRNIGAEAIGDNAEALEKAAKAEELDFVHAHNDAFIQAVEALLAELSTALQTKAASEALDAALPVKDRPDPAQLLALRAALVAFDPDAVDAALAELSAFSYQDGDGFIAWTSEQALVMNYDEIVARLDCLLGSDPREDTD